MKSGLEQLERLSRVPEAIARRARGSGVSGMLLAASDESVRGFPDPDADAEHWLEHALDLDASGARIIGGGAGTTEAHTAALARALGVAAPVATFARRQRGSRCEVRQSARLAGDSARPGLIASRAPWQRPRPTPRTTHRSRATIELLEVFRGAEKPAGRFSHRRRGRKVRRGRRHRRAAPSTTGNAACLRIFSELVSRHGWEPERETPGGPVISLRRGSARVTLEPGAQLELSGAALPDVHAICAEMRGHLSELRAISQEMNLVWLGIGFQPFARQAGSAVGSETSLRGHEAVSADPRRGRARHDAPHRDRPGELRLVERRRRASQAGHGPAPVAADQRDVRQFAFLRRTASPVARAGAAKSGSRWIPAAPG